VTIYKVVGSYETFYEATIEADSADMAIQIFYQKGGGEFEIDGNWSDVHIDDEFENEEELHENDVIQYTSADYEPDGGKISW
jgi:hypothetical protein